MEISGVKFMELNGLKDKQVIVSTRHARRIKERRLRKELGKNFNEKEVKTNKFKDTLPAYFNN